MGTSQLSQKLRSILGLCKKDNTLKEICKQNKEIVAKKVLASSDFNLDRIKNYPKVLTKLAVSPGSDETDFSYLKNKEVKGKYAIEDVLGCGSQGCVYFAYDKKTHDYVILKSGTDIDNEIKILKMLRRENDYFPRYITDFTDSDNNKYIVTEPLLDNQRPAKDLYFYLKKERNSLTLPQKLSIYMQVLRAVKRLGLLGIKHKDIKPENILYSKDLDVIQIIDYGVACSRTDPVCKFGFTRKYQPEGYNQRENAKYNDISDLFSVIRLLGDIIDISQNKHLIRKLEGDSFDEKLNDLKLQTINLQELVTFYSLLLKYCFTQDCMNFITIDDLIEIFKNLKS